MPGCERCGCQGGVGTSNGRRVGVSSVRRPSVEPDWTKPRWVVSVIRWYVETVNPNHTFGCVAKRKAQDAAGASATLSSANNMTDVQRECLHDPTCRGFYANDVGSWFIAADTAPENCHDPSANNEPYPGLLEKGRHLDVTPPHLRSWKK